MFIRELDIALKNQNNQANIESANFDVNLEDKNQSIENIEPTLNQKYETDTQEDVKRITKSAVSKESADSFVNNQTKKLSNNASENIKFV